MRIYGNEDRSVMLGRYLLNNQSTVRATAAYFGISKSTVHKDLEYKLKKINPALYSIVKEILDKYSAKYFVSETKIL